jgi:hypothetical protein
MRTGSSGVPWPGSRITWPRSVPMRTWGYHAAASAGSSGRRGVYLYDWNGWIGWYLTMRQAFRLRVGTPLLPGASVRGAVVGGNRATHVSSAAAQTFHDSGHVLWSRFPVTAPLSCAS